jgi:hypothetical protein
MLLWNVHFSLIRTWLVVHHFCSSFFFVFFSLWASNETFMGLSFSLLNNGWAAFCRLFLARRWLHQSLLFLTWQHKFVMQSKPEQCKVLDNLSHCISCFVINCNIGHLTWLIAPDKNHGVILLPEGLIESIPEVYALLKVIAFVSPCLASFANVWVLSFRLQSLINTVRMCVKYIYTDIWWRFFSSEREYWNFMHLSGNTWFTQAWCCPWQHFITAFTMDICFIWIFAAIY